MAYSLGQMYLRREGMGQNALAAVHAIESVSRQYPHFLSLVGYKTKQSWHGFNELHLEKSQRVVGLSA